MEPLDLTDRMVGITMTEKNLKSAIGLHPKFPLRKDGIYQLFGKVLGHASIGVWLEPYWVGKPRPPGGVQQFESERLPAFLIQWAWVITMTLHRERPDPDEWLRRELDGLEEPCPDPIECGGGCGDLQPRAAAIYGSAVS